MTKSQLLEAIAKTQELIKEGGNTYDNAHYKSMLERYHTALGKLSTTPKKEDKK